MHEKMLKKIRSQNDGDAVDGRELKNIAMPNRRPKSRKFSVKNGDYDGYFLHLNNQNVLRNKFLFKQIPELKFLRDVLAIQRRRNILNRQALKQKKLTITCPVSNINSFEDIL